MFEALLTNKSKIKETFTKKAAMVRARNAPVVGGISGKLYIFGGTTGGTYPTTIDCYTPETNSWTQLTPTLTGRNQFIGGVINGKLYIHGGYNPTGGARSDTWCYDPVANTWIQVASAATTLTGSFAAVVGTKLYAFTGVVAGQWSKAVRCYDTTTDAWTVVAPFPGLARQNASAAAVGTKIYVYGGYGSDSSILKDHWAYDTIADTWTQLLPPVAPPKRYSHTAVTINDKIYIHGGFDTAYMGELWCYDTVTNTWTQLNTGSPIASHASAAIGGTLYSCGGGNQTSSETSDTWAYRTT